MKPLERIFFIACVREQTRVINSGDREFSVRIIGKIFSRLGFSYKQLMRYVQKWKDKGFYDYGAALDLGWFEFEELVGEYKTIYDEIRYSGYDYWRKDEFSQYIVKETNRKTITNFAMRMKYEIGEDDEFYWTYNSDAEMEE